MKNDVELLTELRECQKQLGELYSNYSQEKTNNIIKELRELIYGSSDSYISRDSIIKPILEGRGLCSASRLLKISNDFYELAFEMAKIEDYKNKKEDLGAHIRALKTELGIQ